MPYRQLPEQGRAREQIDLKVQRRLRALERRTRYPGSRRIREAASVTASTPSDKVYLTMNVDRGSWLVNAGLNVIMADAAGVYTYNVIERVSVYIFAYDQATEALINDDGQIGPPGRWAHHGPASGAVSGATLRQPFTLFGHGAFEESARLELRVVMTTVGTGHPVTLQDLCLQATPM